MPSRDALAENELLRRLRSPQPSAPAEGGAPAASPAPAPTAALASAAPAPAPEEHPMRGVLLSYVLQPELWSSTPSFFGRTLKRSHYSLSLSGCARRESSRGRWDSKAFAAASYAGTLGRAMHAHTDPGQDPAGMPHRATR